MGGIEVLRMPAHYIELNSADFQKNGFSFDDACEVVNRLEALGVDVVELSGGSYEAPAMQGQTRDDTTLAREAYFLEFAHRSKKNRSPNSNITKMNRTE